jgi:hypothetical protein
MGTMVTTVRSRRTNTPSTNTPESGVFQLRAGLSEIFYHFGRVSHIDPNGCCVMVHNETAATLILTVATDLYAHIQSGFWWDAFADISFVAGWNLCVPFRLRLFREHGLSHPLIFQTTANV